MNGKMIGSKPLYVALAQRKEERRARLQVTLTDEMSCIHIPKMLFSVSNMFILLLQNLMNMILFLNYN